MRFGKWHGAFSGKKMKNKGFFITLEGGEGCGKSTQLPLLAEALRGMFPGREVVAARSPGGTPVAEKIRALLKERMAEEIAPETELLLFGACHAQMTRTLIRPALERGAILVSDRFFDSTIVYQGVARGLGKDTIRAVNAFACGDLKPDLTLLLDLDPSAGSRRAHARAAVENDRFDSESPAFHQAIRAGFLALAQEEPDRFAVIDASGTVESVHNAVMEAVRDKLA